MSDRIPIERGVTAYLRWRESGDSSPANLVTAILEAVRAPAVPSPAPSDAAIEAASQHIADALDAVDPRGAPYQPVAPSIAAAALRAAYAAQFGVSGGAPATP